MNFGPGFGCLDQIRIIPSRKSGSVTLVRASNNVHLLLRGESKTMAPYQDQGNKYEKLRSSMVSLLDSFSLNLRSSVVSLLDSFSLNLRTDKTIKNVITKYCFNYIYIYI